MAVCGIESGQRKERGEITMKRLPVGIQVYGLRDLLENTPENFRSVMLQIK